MDKKQKDELIELISNTEDEVLLNQVKAILEGNQILIWDELNPALKESIQRGLDQSLRNEVTPHAKVMTHLRSQLK